MICLLCHCDLLQDSTSEKALRQCEPSLWSSLCKILGTTADESFGKIFRKCQFCEGCSVIVEKSKEALGTLERVEREILGLRCQLKACLRRSFVTQLNTGQDDIYRDCADVFRSLLTQDSDREPDPEEVQNLPLPNYSDTDSSEAARDAPQEETTDGNFEKVENVDPEGAIQPETTADMMGSPELQNDLPQVSIIPVKSESVSGTARDFRPVLIKDLQIKVERLSDEIIAKATENKSGGVQVTRRSGRSGSRNRTFMYAKTRAVDLTRGHPNVPISESQNGVPERIFEPIMSQPVSNTVPVIRPALKKELHIKVERLSEDIIAKATGKSGASVTVTSRIGGGGGSSSRKRTLQHEKTRTVYITRKHAKATVSDFSKWDLHEKRNEGDPSYSRSPENHECSATIFKPCKNDSSEQSREIFSLSFNNSGWEPKSIDARTGNESYHPRKSRGVASGPESTSPENKLCDGFLKTEESPRDHNGRLHGENLKYRLSAEKLASISFIKEPSLTHVRKLHKCDDCQAMFDSDLLLDKHRREVHPCEKVSKFACKECGKEYKDAGSLKEHKRYHGKRMYACSVCDKKFHSSTMLIFHELTHSRKRYNCISCPKRFMNEACLKRHRKRVHPREDPFEGLSCYCPTCGELLRDHFALKRHERSHHSNQVYECNFCDETFQSHSLLAEHLGKREEILNS